MKRHGIISDLHLLKKTGLVPPRWRLRADVNGKLQQYLYRCWQHFVAACPPLDALTINGDITDGDTPTRDLKGATSDDWNDQQEAAGELLAPLLKKVRKLYIVRGTPFHEGKAGDVVESIAAALDASGAKSLRARHGYTTDVVKWAHGGRRYSGHILDLEFAGKSWNISHHNTRGWLWLAGATQRMATLAAAAEATGKMPHADVIVRSDLHSKVVTLVQGKWVVFTPGWTVPDVYAIRKMEAVRAHLSTDIGAVVASVHPDGDIGWQSFDYPLYRSRPVRG